MATSGWGRCPRCGVQYKTLMMRGICNDCMEKDRRRVFFDRIATPDKLRHHPDLAETELYLDELYPIQ